MTLAIRDLSVASLDGQPLLRDVSIDVQPGQAVGLVGSSGSGKTLTALAGIGMLPRGVRVTGGNTHLAERDTRTLSAVSLRRLLRETVGYVPQDPLAALDPLFRIGDQVTEPGRLARGTGWREVARSLIPKPMPQAAVTLLDAVGIGPADRAAHFPHQFSGGMRQRALIAAATSLSPALVIADEPTTALDASLERQILDLLCDGLKQRGGALLLISHDLNLVAWYCETAYVMADGMIVDHGRTERLFRAPAHPLARRLLLASPALTPAVAAQPRQPVQNPALLEMSGVSRTYAVAGGRRVDACRNVSLIVRRGEFVGLVGESGSGKSTLGRMALALEPPDDGQVVFDGDALTKLSATRLRALRRRFQPVFQDPLSSLNPRWRIARSILHPLRINGLCGWPSETEALRSLLGEVELAPDLARRFPHEISGGQRQRACIARALATRPDLLVADEALSALDVITQAAVLDLFERLRGGGMAILFISHDLRTVRRISDRIAVMSQGRVVETGTPEQIFDDPRDPYTAGLLASLLPPRFATSSQRSAP